MVSDMGMQQGKGSAVFVLLTGAACNGNSAVRALEGGVYAILEPEIQQEKRQLEKQVISGFAPMHLFSFSAPTHAYTLSDLFCFRAFVCA